MPKTNSKDNARRPGLLVVLGMIGVTPFFGIEVLAETVEVGDTGITFVPPEELGPLPQAVIDLKWPNKNAPSFVVGNAGATTTIAYDVKPRDISGFDIEELRALFDTNLSRVVPGIQWKRNAVIEHEGKSWVYLEMTSTALDTDIYNIMMFTSFEKKMLIFNFNSTKEDFPKYESVLRESIKTIRLPDGG